MPVFLITGGAGSLGRRLLEELLKPKYKATRIAVLDNHENGMAHLRVRFNDSRIRWFLGDIRDKDRVVRAMENVDVCIHCAALKHADLSEYNPFEYIKTDVYGTQNCIEAALEANIDKFMFISSDKAVEAACTYGRCKALSESLTLDANSYKGDRRTKFAVCRPPNYMKSDGSVFEIWDYQKSHGLPLTVTDERMFRYFMEFGEIIKFILNAVRLMEGGEIFVPINAHKLRIIDLAKSYAIDEDKVHEIQITGMRRGEKFEEILIDKNEKERADVIFDMYVIR
jgi:UDP-N-acetylglucosamine 4,6-dehydratase